MNRIACAGLAVLALSTLPALGAEEKSTVSREQVERAVAAAWSKLPPELQARVEQDQTMRDCSQYHNDPPKPVADAILVREKATIVYPPDNQFMGDWKKGEKSALSGYGGRMGDDPQRGNGGNCYACHQLTTSEISFGTLGPSLLGYGRAKDFSPAAQKELYERIYNPQSALACSNMPRFGHNKFLTVDQIKDLVALLMDPNSPVNK